MEAIEKKIKKFLIFFEKTLDKYSYLWYNISTKNERRVQKNGKDYESMRNHGQGRNRSRRLDYRKGYGNGKRTCKQGRLRYLHKSCRKITLVKKNKKTFKKVVKNA
jgi:hypothetical protein